MRGKFGFTRILRFGLSWSFYFPFQLLILPLSNARQMRGLGTSLPGFTSSILSSSKYWKCWYFFTSLKREFKKSYQTLRYELQVTCLHLRVDLLNGGNARISKFINLVPKKVWKCLLLLRTQLPDDILANAGIAIDVKQRNSKVDIQQRPLLKPQKKSQNQVKSSN